MKNVKTLLLVSLAAVSVGMGSIGLGCGGDDTSPGGTTGDGGPKDQQVADNNNTQDTAPPDVNQPDTAPKPLATGPIDRMGRPGINTLLIGDDNKQAYNKAATWAAPPGFVATDFDKHLKGLDLFDGKQDWPPLDGGPHLLVGPLGAGAPAFPDIVIVDPNQNCPDKGSYLDIEFELLGVYALPDGGTATHQTCGGRTPNDDVIDHSLTALVLGPAAARWTPTGGGVKDPLGDCVDQATQPADLVFPFLKPPN